MRIAFPCEACGGLMAVYDRRKVGSGYQLRAKCKCGESTKLVYPMENNFMLLRPRRKQVLDPAVIDAKIERKETTTDGKD